MEASQLRKRMPVSALFDPKIVLPAIGSAFVKLDPRTLMKNPVMFVLEVVAALTTDAGQVVERPGPEELQDGAGHRPQGRRRRVG